MLTTVKELLSDAQKRNKAVCAFNVNNMELVQAITEAANELKADIILQVSKGARNYANPIYLRKLVEAAVEATNIKIALHLDHGDSFELCKDCIESGFTSVMIDGSHLSFEDNIALTKRVVEYAKAHNVSVEGELGILAGVEDEVSSDKTTYTDPQQALEFVQRTGVDSLAIAIGTSHGAYKYTCEEDAKNLRLDILAQIQKLIPKTPLVLHGASSVTPSSVETINKNGGRLVKAFGTPEELLAKTIPLGVRKINIDSDLRLAFTAKIREYFNQNPEHFDPRQYLSPARKAVKEIVAYKLKMFTL